MFQFWVKNLFILLTFINYQSISAECQGDVCFQADDPTEPIKLQTIMPPLKVGAKTYYVETFFQANWFRANQFCRYQGMELASLSNKEEDDKLLVALQATYGLDLHFWTSGNDLAINGTYFWLSTGADFQYEGWGKGEPNHLISGDEIEHCVEVRGLNGNLSWNDKICSFEAYVICEK